MFLLLELSRKQYTLARFAVHAQILLSNRCLMCYASLLALSCGFLLHELPCKQYTVMHFTVYAQLLLGNCFYAAMAPACSFLQASSARAVLQTVHPFAFAVHARIYLAARAPPAAIDATQKVK